MVRYSITLLAIILLEVACAHSPRNNRHAVSPAVSPRPAESKPLIRTIESLHKFMAAARLPQLIANPDVGGACIAVALSGELKLDIYVNQEAVTKYGPPDLPGIPRNAIRVIATDRDFVALGAAKMGTSTSTAIGCSVGTLGIAAVDVNDPSVTGYITCNHVAASSNGCFDGQEVDQVTPGNCDSPHCIPVNPPIGKRLRSAPISSTTTTTDVDAAFVASNAVDTTNDCGLCATGVVVAPEDILGKPVRKCGRTTWFTCGIVTGIGCTTKIKYHQCDSVTLVNQIRVSSAGFALGGDSGAALFAADGGVVGLVFAGNKDDIAWANPMSAVLNELKVSLQPGADCRTQPECLQAPRSALLGCPGYP